MTDTLVIEETTPAEIELTKSARIKKFITNPKTLLVAAGSAILIVGGAVVFALSRMDEDDFDDADDNVIVLEETPSDEPAV